MIFFVITKGFWAKDFVPKRNFVPRRVQNFLWNKDLETQDILKTNVILCEQIKVKGPTIFKSSFAPKINCFKKTNCRKEDQTSENKTSECTKTSELWSSFGSLKKRELNLTVKIYYSTICTCPTYNLSLILSKGLLTGPPLK